MISTADFRNGMILVLDGDLMEIIEFQHVKPGKGGAFVRTRLKNFLTGKVLEKTYRSGEKFEEARVEEQAWQYLYTDGDLFYFMHPDTYEQTEVGSRTIGENAQWMKDNSNVSLFFHEGRVIDASVPAHVVLKVTGTEPGVQGDRAQGATKGATLESGATVQVPLFINEGDMLKVDTRTGEYIERVNV
jgi:elongation factor P